MNPENVYPWTLQQQPKINISQKKHKKTKSSDFSFQFISKFKSETKTINVNNYSSTPAIM
jgi:hypothetical protein